jgi:DNA-binding HxlR family transcriptional regulator
MDQGSYGQFCPVAMASEIVCTRWTALVLRELLSGSKRFNDLRRGVPTMSPTLLSKRLSELEDAGIITRAAKGSEYELTPAGEELKPVIMALGEWGQAWIESHLSLKNLDPSLLMWDMRRRLNPTPLPPQRCTIRFRYPELASGKQNWWLVVEDGEVDLCLTDPGHEVNLYVTGPLRAMTTVWMGLTTLAKEMEAGTLEVLGDRDIASSMQMWLGLSPFAAVRRKVAA